MAKEATQITPMQILSDQTKNVGVRDFSPHVVPADNAEDTTTRPKGSSVVASAEIQSSETQLEIPFEEEQESSAPAEKETTSRISEPPGLTSSLAPLSKSTRSGKNAQPAKE